MKVNSLRGVLFSIVMLSCLAAAGCNNSKDNNSQNKQIETAQNENAAVTAVSIHEQGGEDGRIIDWEIYQDDNQYILSYSDHRYTDKSRLFEITEQEYDDIMSLDYAKYISEYDSSYWEGVDDAIYFQTTITYANGEEESTEAIMTYATIKLGELLRKYEN